jgi:hypothetical protein
VEPRAKTKATQFWRFSKLRDMATTAVASRRVFGTFIVAKRGEK